jgi:glucokinase
MRQRSIHLLSASTVVHPAIFKDIGGALGAANFALDEHMSFSFLNV